MSGFNQRPKSKGQGASAPRTARDTARDALREENSAQRRSAARLNEAENSKQLFTESTDNAARAEEMRRAEAAKRAEKRRLEEQQAAAKKAEELRRAEEERRAAAKARKAAMEAAAAEEKRIALQREAEALNAQKSAPEPPPEEKRRPVSSLTSELFFSEQGLNAAADTSVEGAGNTENAAAKRTSSGAFASRPSGRQPKHKYKEVSQNDEKKNQPKGNIFVRFFRAVFPQKGDGVAESVRKVIFDVAVVAFIITGGSVLLDVFDEFKNSQISDKVIVDSYRDDINNNATEEEIIGSLNLTEDEITAIKDKKPGINYSFMELYNKNSDIVGWIRIGEKDNAIIDYPVMHTTDNDYYLTHNFDRQESKRGAIYADWRNTFDDNKLSGNTILYGHNMWTGDTMFAKLSRYYDARLQNESTDRLNFYKEHPTVTFNTLYEDSEWKVFACILFNTQQELGEVYPYNNVISFPNKDAFNGFILDLMDRSVLWTDVDLTYGDEILTLSTCYYPWTKEVADTRVAVFARKVREGESPEVDVSKAVTNNNPLKFTFQYQKEGGSWTGRTWDTSKLLSYEP